MRFEPLIPLWILIPGVSLALGAIGRYLWTMRKQPRVIWLPWARRATIVSMLLLIGIGPSVAVSTMSPGIANIDAIFAVDTTASMGAQDYGGDLLRLDVAKQDLLLLGQKLQGAHIAIITYDSKANLLLPFTTDRDTFANTVQTLSREVYSSSKGSSIDRPVALIIQQLKNSKLAHPERSRMVFYFGDGEQTANEPPKTFKPVAEYVDGGAVLGYGTSSGAKILRYAGIGGVVGKQQYVTVADSATKSLIPATSKLDAAALKKIAGEMNLSYHHRNTDTPIDQVYEQSQADKLIQNGDKITTFLGIYWLFAVPLVVLLFWELRISLNEYLKVSQTKDKKHA